MKNIPRYIIKKSAKWYYNTHSGAYIHVDNLKAYVAEQAQLKLKL